jgi:uncharacterized protein GlcG (DUF336 family)
MNPSMLREALEMTRQTFPTGKVVITACIVEKDGMVNSFVDVDAMGMWARGQSLNEAIEAMAGKMSAETWDKEIAQAEQAVHKAKTTLKALRMRRHVLSVTDRKPETVQ